MSNSHTSEGRKGGSAKLVSGSIGWHLFNQSWPMMIGIACIMSVGIIDAYFIGRLGTQQLAAISFIFPISIALSSLGVGVIAGINSVVSRALGEDNQAKARQLATLGMVLAILAGLVIAGLLYAFREPLFRLMQAEDDLLPIIDAYMLPYALGYPLQLVIMGCNGVLRGQGAAKSAATILLSYAMLNWILDPILIHGGLGLPGYGISGAAYATIWGWAGGLIVGLFFVWRAPLSLTLSSLKQCNIRQQSLALLRVAGPAALSNSINPIGLSILTALLATFGSQMVAGFGAAGRLQNFAVVPMLALSSSIGAIAGQNWGAAEKGRARKALLYACGFCLAYGLLLAAALVVWREDFAGLFSEEGDVVNAVGQYLTIAAWGYGAYGVVIVVNGALNAVDHAGMALAQSAARIFLFMLPVAFIGSRMIGSENWVFAGELVANIAGALVAAYVAWRIFGKSGIADKADR